MRRAAQHGTHSKYSLGCRCPYCSVAERTYQRAYARTKRRKVSAEPAREHIIHLSSYGLGQIAIAEACGCGPATVKKIRSGQQKMIYRRTLERILSVTPEAIKDHALVDATNAKRMIQELIDEGYDRKAIGRLIGDRALRYLYNDKVQARTELKIEKLYRRDQTRGLRDLIDEGRRIA